MSQDGNSWWIKKEKKSSESDKDALKDTGAN